MLCSKCKKRVAVVFVTKMDNGKPVNEGYCIPCAREMNLPNIRNIIDRMGMTEEDIEAVNESMAQLIGDGDMFEPGGTAPMPFFQVSGDKESKDDGKKQRGKGKKAQEQPEKEQKRKFLDGFCINLSERVRQGKVDRIIGRDKEIYRAVQILNRRIKNNPCLIGEAGVGKTAIAEGLAYALQHADFIPPRLRKKEIHLLDLTALVAGTQFRGQFESRVKGLVDEVKREGNIILFIDEVHNLIGTGESEGGMNAANILKPALSRGEIQVIGATTFGEYRKYIEKDAALERRFQTINVDEPSVAETAAILEGIKGYYEEHHGVKLDDGLCYKAASLAAKYITDRFMPDKAIDLIDEACSTASIKNKEAAKLAELEEKIAELSAREEELTNVEASEGGEENKDEIFKEIADLRVERCRLEEDAEKLRQKNLIMPVTIAELASVIELWTGIPADRIKEQEFDKLSLLEERIKRRVIGQDEAVEAVVRAVKRARAGLTTRRRPASFVFMGPTGVGKTELVRVMAEELFDTKENFIRLDMSEYMEKHSVSKLVGSPPGYIGYDEQGQLTERVRRKPNSIILFDEIEKAHADVLNILLQILDEGRLTDAHGRRVNFENTIVVMTSNAGSGTGVSTLGFTGGGGGSFDKTKAEKALKEIMRPELLSRIDDVIFFNKLTLDNYKDIAGLMLDELASGMKEKGLSLEYGDDVRLWLASRAEGSQQSARELRRLIRRNVEDEVAELMVTGKIKSGVALSADGEELKITAK
ncbi:MAG: ATP-dependent Clp protease ATP-binding subunit [Clostridia bacterium]|nr:ATP-dependent Clp protease ATP-binding subunit [Clostridia bacterium]